MEVRFRVCGAGVLMSLNGLSFMLNVNMSLLLLKPGRM